MTDVHGLLGRGALILTLVAAAWNVGLVVVRRPPGRATLGLLVVVFIAVVLAAAAGALTAVAIAPPHDPLHFLYAVLALVALPVAALIAAFRPERQQAWVLFMGATVESILLVRLLQTGAT